MCSGDALTAPGFPVRYNLDISVTFNNQMSMDANRSMNVGFNPNSTWRQIIFRSYMLELHSCVFIGIPQNKSDPVLYTFFSHRSIV